MFQNADKLKKLCKEPSKVAADYELKTMELIANVYLGNTPQTDAGKIDAVNKYNFHQCLHDELNNMLTGKTMRSEYNARKKSYDRNHAKFIEWDDDIEWLFFLSYILGEMDDEIKDSKIGFMRTYNGKKEFQTVDKYVKSIMTEKKMHGNMTEEELAKSYEKMVNQMTQSGMKIRKANTNGQGDVEYRYYGVQSYIDVMCGEAVKDANEFIVEKDMDRLGTRYVEVSAHTTARPTHQIWQGQVYYWSVNGEPDPLGQYKDFVRETGYGSVDGLCGINCYHSFWAFNPAIDKRRYDDKKLQALINERPGLPPMRNIDDVRRREYAIKAEIRRTSNRASDLQRKIRKYNYRAQLLGLSPVNADEAIAAAARRNFYIDALARLNEIWQ